MEKTVSELSKFVPTDVLLILASDLLRYYRFNFSTLWRSQAGETPAKTVPAAAPKE